MSEGLSGGPCRAAVGAKRPVAAATLAAGASCCNTASRCQCVYGESERVCGVCSIGLEGTTVVSCAARSALAVGAKRPVAAAAPAAGAGAAGEVEVL